LAPAPRKRRSAAQILYAFHTEDTHQLLELARNIAVDVRDHGAGAAMRYHWPTPNIRYGPIDRGNRSRCGRWRLAICIDEMADTIKAERRGAGTIDSSIGVLWRALRP